MNPIWSNDPAPTLIAANAARFRDPADSRLPCAPSFAFLTEPKPIAPVPGGWRIHPQFARSGEGAATKRIVRIALDAGTSLYGCGEAAGRLERAGRKIVCNNTDSFDYSDATPSLYQSHPWVLGVRADGTSFGVLADTTCKIEIDLTSTDWMANGTGEAPAIVFRVDDRSTPPFAIYVIERDHPQEVVRTLAELTGKIPMPPRWALGYHQCRWSYEPDERARTLARDFRAKQIPCDVIWFDIDYMDGFRCFTFDPVKFADPVALNRDLHALGFKTIWMIDPGLKHDPEYAVYKAGREAGHFLQNVYGGEYHGTVWPGPCAFPDFTRASARAWWATLYRDYMATGIDGVWNDMNEPAIFDNEAKQMPADVWHRADEALGGPGPHSRYHNVYGYLMVKASREGIAAANPDKRPFILTRSNFIGGQRFAATWTGDNRSSWEHLHWSITMALNLSLSGQPFVGPDIGGFVGEADGKLFARWMGIGALLPFSRAHSIKDSADHEPWSFGEACEATCRRALTRRYRLLPYIYTLFRAAHVEGLPVVRPLFFADPSDARLREADDAFLLGGDVLVRASVREDGSQRAPLPKGVWRAWDPTPMDDGLHDPELPELRFRAGSIVPMGPAMQYHDEKPLDPLTLIVTPDEHGHAQGVLYEDAGEGHGYAHADYRLTRFTCRREGDRHVVTHEHLEGERPAAARAIEVLLLLATGMTRQPL